MTLKIDDARAREVLSFWLGDDVGPYSLDPEKAARWFQKDPAFDDEVRRRFGSLLEAAQDGRLEESPLSPKTRIAHVILLDQLSRNAFRDDARMFAGDARARRLVEDAIAAGHEASLSAVERYFLYMPLMHSEELGDQEECLRRLRALFADLPPEQRAAPVGKVLAEAERYAILHKDIIARFGRFPHRNAILGRETTEEERVFLTQPNSSF